MRISSAIGLLLLVCPVTAFAASVVDQSHELTQSFGSSLIYAGSAPAQTFTAGAGGVLSQVDVLLRRDAGDIGELSLELWPVVAGGPAGSTPLFSTSINPSDVPVGSSAYVPVDVSSHGFPVLPGEQYAIALNGSASLSSANSSWSRGAPGYEGGGVFDRSGVWEYASSTSDYGFRTWVDPEITPSGLSFLEVAPSSEWQASLSESGASVIYAAGQTMRVDRSPINDEDMRGLIEYDTSGLPTGANVKYAKLDFEINQHSQSGSVYPVVDIYGYQADGAPSDAQARDLSHRLGGTAPIDSFDPIAVALDAGELAGLLDGAPMLGLNAYMAEPYHGVNIIASELADTFPQFYSPPTLTIGYATDPQPRLPAGDYNGDARVDAADYAVWRNAFGLTGDQPADGDGDQHVDEDDYVVWREAFGVAPDNRLENGDFETGDLSGWETTIGPNTNISSGFPRVESFDVNGDGQSTDAFRVRLGRSDTSLFGGSISLTQEVLLDAGDYELSVDIASQSLEAFGNSGPGNYELSVDGVIVDQVLLQGTLIDALEVIRDELFASLIGVQAGCHTIGVTISRGATNSRAIYQFIDNIEITPAPASTVYAAPEPTCCAMAFLASVLVAGSGRRARECGHSKVRNARE